MFEGGRTFTTPASNIMLTASVLLLDIPFDGSYYTNYTFLEAGQEVSVAYRSVIWEGDNAYVDKAFVVATEEKDHFVLAATVDSDKWPKWSSTWAASYGAAASVESHFLGRFDVTDWGDYYILAAEPEPNLVRKRWNLRKNFRKLRLPTP